MPLTGLVSIGRGGDAPVATTSRRPDRPAPIFRGARLRAVLDLALSREKIANYPTLHKTPCDNAAATPRVGRTCSRGGHRLAPTPSGRTARREGIFGIRI